MNTREQIAQLRQDNPCLTLEQIGYKVGVSRERVRQLLNKEGLPTKHHIRQRYCVVCGETIPHYNTKGNTCSMKCFKKLHSVTLICTACGKEFARKVSDILDYNARLKHRGTNKSRVGFFCNKKCFGRWLGMMYGCKFSTNPQHLHSPSTTYLQSPLL